MELDTLNKYVHITRLAQNVEVMFAGQPCLNIFESGDSYYWRINPVFAKLTYGADVFNDIPYCNESFDMLEAAIATGLEKLYDLGAFRNEVDLPADTYSNVTESVSNDVEEISNSIKEDCRREAMKHSDSLMEAQDLAVGLYDSIVEAYGATKKAYDPFAAAISKVMARPANVAPAKRDEPEKEPEPEPKKKNGRPTNIDLDSIREKAMENIKAGKRPTTGFERNEKIHFVRHLKDHPDFAEHHVSAAGRAHGTTAAEMGNRKAAVAASKVDNVMARWAR